MRKFFRKFFIVLLVIVTLVGGIYLLRFPILRGLGNALIKEDTAQKSEAMFILSGQADERVSYARYIDKEMGLAPKIITLGAGISPTLQAIGMSISDAEIARRALISGGIDSLRIEAIPIGTSTFEESEEILGFSQVRGYKKIIILSSKFHTRRVRNVFRDKFREAGIEVVIMGAEPKDYELEKWWEDEAALLFVNNEYVKLLYYAIRY
ncbi:MAG: YdcF family protein [Bacteroidota bacterium]